MNDRKWQPRPAIRHSQSSPTRYPASRGLYNSKNKALQQNATEDGAQPTRGARRKPAPKINTARSWHKEQRHGVIIAVSLTLALGAFMIGYGVQAQIAAEATRTAQRAEQIALTTKEALRAGPGLFVPVQGNVCRQRWIDNATWTVSDGQDVVCDEAASWTINTKPEDQSVAIRMDAVRDGFRVNGNPGN